MAAIQYFIRASKKSDTATIRVRLSAGRGKLCYATTEYSIPVSAWDDKKQTIKRTAKFDDTFTFDAGQKIIEGLAEIEKRINSSFNTKEDEVTSLWLQKIVDGYFESLKPKKIDISLNEYISIYIKDMKSGKRMTSNKLLYSPGTIKNKVSFKSEFDKFQKDIGKVFNYDDITIDLYNDFVNYFNEKQYSPNTTGKHIKTLKEIMSASREEGLHNNFQTTLKAFKILSYEPDTIYLTRKEISLIESIDLSKKKELDICRDVFLVGVYIAQRFSDYHRINETNLISLENGKKAIKLTQQKTNAKVVIPCSIELINILKKYNYQLPKVTSQLLNENIKIVCRMAKITQKIEHTQTKGALIVNDKIEKYKLVSTHTARRTGATLMYLEGIDVLAIMKITGHKTEKEFKKYIRVGEEENALILSNNKFFNRLQIK